MIDNIYESQLHGKYLYKKNPVHHAMMFNKIKMNDFTTNHFFGISNLFKCFTILEI